MPELDSKAGHLLRELTPQVLGVLVRRYRDFVAAEDAVQEAVLAAVQQWPADGVPENPRAWLLQVASRRFVDGVRSDVSRRRREMESAVLQGYTMPAPAEGQVEDDTLALLFLCCHPALTSASAIALTLRTVGGLRTSEIASAFLVPEATMAQRISRAKQTIRDSGITFTLPCEAERTQRLGAVMHVLYLIFNEGYTSSDGEELHRPDLAREAIRLARILRRLAPEDAECAGLLALMLLTDARRAARTGALGELIPLDQQDRSLWDRKQIEEGVALLTGAMSKGAVGMYQLQAAVAAVHGEAARAEDTDWPQILALYGVMKRIAANPMVLLNEAIAVAMVRGAEEGLRCLQALDADPRMAGNHRLDAVRAHLLERAGDLTASMEHYRRAAQGTANASEQRYLLTQAARLADHLRT
ncbi:MAG: DUF6596 domain-containing protein [Bryobacteraceae bacterium]